MSKGENIVKWIKGLRISWLGQLERMEEDRMPKKIFTEELEGTRRRGRPRKRWEEEVERDLQVLGVRRWRELVADRKKMEGHCSTGQSPQWAVVPTCVTVRPSWCNCNTETCRSCFNVNFNIVFLRQLTGESVGG